jgi:hypothetical protein
MRTGSLLDQKHWLLLSNSAPPASINESVGLPSPVKLDHSFLPKQRVFSVALDFLDKSPAEFLHL